MTPETERAIRANLASLNEIIAEMVVVTADDADFIRLVHDTLRDHSWALGYSFRGERG